MNAPQGEPLAVGDDEMEMGQLRTQDEAPDNHDAEPQRKEPKRKQPKGSESEEPLLENGKDDDMLV